MTAAAGTGISIGELMAELLRYGTDERLIRGLLVLARHVNLAFAGLGSGAGDPATDPVGSAPPCEKGEIE